MAANVQFESAKVFPHSADRANRVNRQCQILARDVHTKHVAFDSQQYSTAAGRELEARQPLRRSFYGDADPFRSS